jgi:uncharacterized protein
VTRFSWDAATEETNRCKHGVSFDTVRVVFDDPLHLSRQDRAEDMARGGVLLLVAHTWREGPDGEEHIRIVSARRATNLWRKIYEEGP